MTKSNLIHHIISTWGGENQIDFDFDQQSELVKELSKWLMLKKIRKSKSKRGIR